MKKVLAWGLALMMAGSLVGCSQSDSGSTSAAATEGGSEAAAFQRMPLPAMCLPWD